MLSREQSSQVSALLDELLDLPEYDRVRRLRTSGVKDPQVLVEVESLLRSSRSAQSFLSQPAALAPLPAPEPVNAQGTRLGIWLIKQQIGRGGMGEVYEAERAAGDFAQRVAIKVLQPEAGAQLGRFQEERRILASLDHPGIARLFDGGVTSDGRPYMVMEFVEGRSITDFCAQQRLGLTARLDLFVQVCEAVAYAHRNLVVHRDLKPSNILVTDDRRVKLLDFGIAKLLDTDRAHLTQTAFTPLTPRCAAPEQITGQPITTATDVYALGLLLFELLTDTHPWFGADTPALQALRAVLERPAPVPSRVAAGRPEPPIAAKRIRGDLDAIVAKALRIEPTRRFATVEAFKVDVERMQRGAPVAAREGARVYVLGRLLKRYRWAAAGVGAVILSLAGGLGVAAWQAQRAASERDAARRDASREEAVRYSLTGLFSAALANKADGPQTAKGMIDTSAQRVLREYRDRPQLAGGLVLSLADLYGALEDIEGAGGLLEGFLVQAGPGTDPATVADVRQKLANIELFRGHRERAKFLLDQAAAFWAGNPRGYAEERLEGLGIRAKLQRLDGDIDGAIATNREAIAQRVALSGRDHRETAILYNSLAISLAAANRLDEALAAYRETTAIYTALGLGDGLDAQIILANTGTLELREGEVRDAEVLLKKAFERERTLAGDSAAVAAAMGYYGKALTLTDRAAPAVTVLTQAAELGARFAGAGSPLALQNRLLLADAQLAAGDRRAAIDSAAAAQATASAQYGPGNPLTLRAALALAQVAVASGDYAGAAGRVQTITPGLRKLGSQGEPYLALALLSLGECQLARNQTAAAIASLREVVALRGKLAHHSWDQDEASERLGEALAAAGERAGAAGLIRQALANLTVELGANHSLTRRAQSALDRLQT